MAGAFNRYIADVKDGSFPGEEESFGMDESVLEELGYKATIPG